MKMKLPPEYQDRPGGGLDWFFENEDEYLAVIRAEDGDPFPLADLIASRGCLRTHEARAWVSARLRGEQLPRGAKRTAVQMTSEMIMLGDVRQIMQEEAVKEHRAIELLCDRNPKLKIETVKTHVRRAKALVKQIKDEAAAALSGSRNPES